MSITLTTNSTSKRNHTKVNSFGPLNGATGSIDKRGSINFLKGVPRLSRFKRLKDKQKARFYADLHLLLSSGLDINTSFEILISQAKGEWERKQYKGVRLEIIAGLALADAMRKMNLAGSYEYYSLKIGEESGKIEAVLLEIKRYYERKIKQKRQVSGALTYPVMVLFTAVVAVGFMLNVIVPMFEEVFNRFQGNLPLLTQKIIDLSEWMKRYGWIVLLSIVGLALAFKLLIRKPDFLMLWHKCVLHTPLFGKLIKDLESARFCHIMSLLTAAKSPLVQSLEMVADMITFMPLKKSVQSIGQGIAAGEAFHDSVKKTGFFDRKFTSLIKAGEEVNQLEYSFNQLNEQYNQEIDHKLSIMASLMEPVLIILVGGIVAVILIAMYLPLFQIGSSIY